MEERDLMVCCSSPTSFDRAIFECWADGKTQEETTYMMLKTPAVAVGATSSGSSGTSAAAEAAKWVQPARKYNPITKAYSPHFFTASDWAILVDHEVGDQYRMFELLEHFLCQPLLLKGYGQLLQQIPPDTQNYVIDKYWKLDEVVVKEVLWRRLTKSRKDLDDVAESHSLSVRRVTRQFDNIRRVYLAIEEGPKFECNLQSFCVQHYGLALPLARKYACIIFLLYSRLNLTSKKRLQRLSSDAMELSAALILGFLAPDQDFLYSAFATSAKLALASGGGSSKPYMSPSSPSSKKTSAFFYEDIPLELLNGDDERCWTVAWTTFGRMDTVELDKQLLSNLRDVRAVLTGEVLDSGCASVRSALQECGGPITSKKIMDGYRIRIILKALMQIGANLSQSREFRDIFEDLLAKVCEPLEEMGLTTSEQQLFLVCCARVAKEIPAEGPRNMSISSNNYMPDGSVRDGRDRADTSASRVSTGDGSSNRDSIRKYATKGEKLRKDWVRFLTCCRLMMLQLSK